MGTSPSHIYFFQELSNHFSYFTSPGDSAQYGDLRLNKSRFTSTKRTDGMPIRSRWEVANSVISSRFVRSHISPDNAAKCPNPRLNISRDILLQAIGDGIFDSFITLTSD